jgi:hypothetical protein
MVEGGGEKERRRVFRKPKTFWEHVDKYHAKSPP